MHTRQRILNCIQRHIDRTGIPPTVREIAAYCGIPSTSTVSHHLNELERRGAISRQPGKARTIRITTPAAANQN